MYCLHKIGETRSLCKDGFKALHFEMLPRSQKLKLSAMHRLQVCIATVCIFNVQILLVEARPGGQASLVTLRSCSDDYDKMSVTDRDLTIKSLKVRNQFVFYVLMHMHRD